MSSTGEGGPSPKWGPGYGLPVGGGCLGRGGWGKDELSEQGIKTCVLRKKKRKRPPNRETIDRNPESFKKKKERGWGNVGERQEGPWES